MTRITKDLLIRRTYIIVGVGVISALGGWFLSQFFIEFMKTGLLEYGRSLEDWPDEVINESMVWMMSIAVFGIIAIFAYMSAAILWIGWYFDGKREEMKKRGNEGIHNDSPK